MRFVLLIPIEARCVQSFLGRPTHLAVFVVSTLPFDCLSPGVVGISCCVRGVLRRPNCDVGPFRFYCPLRRGSHPQTRPVRLARLVFPTGGFVTMECCASLFYLFQFCCVPFSHRLLPLFGTFCPFRSISSFVVGLAVLYLVSQSIYLHFGSHDFGR